MFRFPQLRRKLSVRCPDLSHNSLHSSLQGLGKRPQNTNHLQIEFKGSCNGQRPVVSSMIPYHPSLPTAMVQDLLSPNLLSVLSPLEFSGLGSCG